MREELTAWSNIATATVLFFMVVKMYLKTQVILNLKAMFVKKLTVIYNLASYKKNEDIDICHILPSKKGKNPIVIKFLKRTKNEIFKKKIPQL